MFSKMVRHFKIGLSVKKFSFFKEDLFKYVVLASFKFRESSRNIYLVSFAFLDIRNEKYFFIEKQSLKVGPDLSLCKVSTVRANNFSF